LVYGTLDCGFAPLATCASLLCLVGRLNDNRVKAHSWNRKGRPVMKAPSISFLVISATLVAACGLAHAQGTIKPSSGTALCSALTSEDLTKAGVAVSALRQANLDGSDGAYCVYDSKAGNVEFDIFFPAGGSAAEVKATEKTVLGEMGVTMQAIPLPGADTAHISLPTAKSASIVVRAGTAVFDLNAPSSPNSRQQLLALARLVLSRKAP